MNVVIERKNIFEIWRLGGSGGKFDAVLCYVLDNLENAVLPSDELALIKKSLRSLCQKFESKWLKVGRHSERFFSYNKKWHGGNTSVSQYTFNNEDYKFETRKAYKNV